MKGYRVVLIILGIALLAIITLGIYIAVAFDPASTTQEQEQIEHIPQENPSPPIFEEQDSSCIALGCDESTQYVGSQNSDKYYTCTCRYAQQVNPENIICFASDAEAVNQGYEKIEGC